MFSISELLSNHVYSRCSKVNSLLLFVDSREPGELPIAVELAHQRLRDHGDMETLITYGYNRPEGDQLSWDLISLLMMWVVDAVPFSGGSSNTRRMLTEWVDIHVKVGDLIFSENRFRVEVEGAGSSSISQ